MFYEVLKKDLLTPPPPSGFSPFLPHINELLKLYTCTENKEMFIKKLLLTLTSDDFAG